LYSCICVIRYICTLTISRLGITSILTGRTGNTVVIEVRLSVKIWVTEVASIDVGDTDVIVFKEVRLSEVIWLGLSE
jgi:hypothetical protein